MTGWIHAHSRLCTVLTAASISTACAHTSEPEAAAPTTTAPNRDDTPVPPRQLTPLTEGELAACHEELSRVHRRLDAGDYSAGAILIDRTNAHSDMTRLCASPTEVPDCFADGSHRAGDVVTCLDRHYCALLRDHGTRLGLVGMRGADDRSKLVFLRQMTREGEVTECALQDELERRVADASGGRALDEDPLLVTCENVSPAESTSGAPNEDVSESGASPGSLPADAIRSAIREQLPAVQHCYESALLREPTLAGTVRVRFDVGPDGSVIRTSVVDNTTDAEGLGCCVASQMLRMRFDAPGGTVRVTYPFVLRQE